jgi:hypothetical protein
MNYKNSSNTVILDDSEEEDFEQQEESISDDIVLEDSLFLPYEKIKRKINEISDSDDTVDSDRKINKYNDSDFVSDNIVISDSDFNFDSDDTNVSDKKENAINISDDSDTVTDTNNTDSELEDVFDDHFDAEDSFFNINSENSDDNDGEDIEEYVTLDKNIVKVPRDNYLTLLKWAKKNIKTEYRNSPNNNREIRKIHNNNKRHLDNEIRKIRGEKRLLKLVEAHEKKNKEQGKSNINRREKRYYITSNNRYD